MLDSTCTLSGWTEGEYCSICNKVLVIPKEIKPIDHDLVIETAREPTCTESGVTEGSYCAACNERFSEQTALEPLGHTEVVNEAVGPTGVSTGLTEGRSCSVCNQVFVPQQTIDILPPVTIDSHFGIITESKATVTTEHIKLNIPANVYIPYDLVDNINTVTSTMELASGLKFEGSRYYANEFLDVNVEKYTDSLNERGPLHDDNDECNIASGDLLLFDTFIHELTHSLQLNQSNWHYCELITEGFAAYTTYKTQKHIEAYSPEISVIVGASGNTLAENYELNYDELFSHSFGYWFENGFNFESNETVHLGFRFMWYLDEVYGNYSKWITAYENENWAFVAFSNQLPIEEQIRAFKSAYGDDVFDGFYSWFTSNENLFKKSQPIDLRDVEKIQLYPNFAYDEIFYEISGAITYNDLFIDIDAGKRYIAEYKAQNIDGMMLDITEGVVVELYDSEGRLLKTPITSNAELIPLDDVSFIKLVGEGIAHEIKIIF